MFYPFVAHGHIPLSRCHLAGSAGWREYKTPLWMLASFTTFGSGRSTSSQIEAKDLAFSWEPRQPCRFETRLAIAGFVATSASCIARKTTLAGCNCAPRHQCFRSGDEVAIYLPRKVERPNSRRLRTVRRQSYGGFCHRSTHRSTGFRTDCANDGIIGEQPRADAVDLPRLLP